MYKFKQKILFCLCVALIIIFALTLSCFAANNWSCGDYTIYNKYSTVSGLELYPFRMLLYDYGNNNLLLITCNSAFNIRKRSSSDDVLCDTEYVIEKQVSGSGLNIINFDNVEYDDNTKTYTCNYVTSTDLSQYDVASLVYGSFYNNECLDAGYLTVPSIDQVALIEKTSDVLVFPQTPQVLTPIFETIYLGGVLQEVMEILPIVLVTIVAMIAIMKAINMIRQKLREV